MSLCFHSPAPSDRQFTFTAAANSGAKENDAAFASIFLLREKYGIEICAYEQFLLRRYHSGLRAGCYGFPIGSGNLKDAVQKLHEDAMERQIPFRFALLTKQQTDLLEADFPHQFRYSAAENYTEYLYLREHLAELRGSRYHGKRNHIAQFWRAYPDAYIQPLIAENAEFAVKIAEQWLLAREDPQEASLQYELNCIREAAANWDALQLSGLLLYAETEKPPIGMEIVSQISPHVWDIHFEKVIPGYPHAWPVVANETAKCLTDAEYLNREEDLGESGMRSSKRSYRPDLLNEKFFAEWCGEEKL